MPVLSKDIYDPELYALIVQEHRAKYFRSGRVICKELLSNGIGVNRFFCELHAKGMPVFKNKSDVVQTGPTYTFEEMDNLIASNYKTMSGTDIFYKYFSGTNFTRREVVHRSTFYNLCNKFETELPWCKFDDCPEKIERFKERHRRKGDTLRKRILSGELDVTTNIGRGNKCWAMYQGKRFHFRSSYELIFALLLSFRRQPFFYENIRLRCSISGKTRVSDFMVNGKLVELKGFHDSSLVDKIDCFKDHGYTVKLVTWKQVKLIKTYLERRGVPVKNYLKVLKEHTGKVTFDISDVRNIAYTTK